MPVLNGQSLIYLRKVGVCPDSQDPRDHHFKSMNQLQVCSGLIDSAVLQTNDNDVLTGIQAAISHGILFFLASGFVADAW